MIVLAIHTHKKIEAVWLVMFDFSKLMTGLQKVVLLQILH